MNRIRTFAPLMLVALTLAAGPAVAAQRGQRDRGSQDRDSRGRGNGNDRSASRGGGRTEAPRQPEARRDASPRVGVAVPRTAPRFERSEPAPRLERREPAPQVQRRDSAPQFQRRDPAPQVQRRDPAPQFQRRDPAPQFQRRDPAPRTFAPNRAFAPRTVVPRTFVRPYPRTVAPRSYVYAPRYYAPRIVGPRPVYRPYYTFRPRFNLSFGLFIGYPVAYPVYYYPYAYAVPVRVPAASGGLSFDITPATAEIFVDGRYMGVVEDYASNMQPLSLAPGRHRIEIHEAGYEPLAFDADVIAGQVIPFQGAMEPQ